MRTRFERLRRLLGDTKFPLEVRRHMNLMEFNEPDEPLKITLKSWENTDWEIWKLAYEWGLVSRASGTAARTLERLTAKGLEFVELSKDKHGWESAVTRCEQANALTYSNLVAELRRAANKRLAALPHA